MPRGDPNPAPIEGFQQPQNDSFRKSFMNKEAYNEHRESKGAKMRDHLVAMSGEFVGTVLFLYFAFAWQLIAIQQQPSTASNGGPSADQIMYTSIGYGFSLLVCAWAFYRISGGLFNPAVSCPARISSYHCNQLIYLIGSPRHVPCRSAAMGPWCLPLRRRVHWLPRRCWTRPVHVPR